MEKLLQALTEIVAEAQKATKPPPSSPAAEIPLPEPDSDDEEFVTMQDTKSESSEVIPAPAPAPATTPPPPKFRIGDRVILRGGDQVPIWRGTVVEIRNPAIIPPCTCGLCVKVETDSGEYKGCCATELDKDKPLREFLEQLIHDKYEDAAIFILHAQAPTLRQEIFNFFAGRWWRDIARFDSNLEEDPKAKIWEALLLNSIVQWKNLWQIWVDKANSLGAIVFFRGTEASRKHMMSIAKQDPVFLGMLHDATCGNWDLAGAAASNVLPKALPYALELFQGKGDCCDTIIRIYNLAIPQRKKYPERTRQCLVFLSERMAACQ